MTSGVYNRTENNKKNLSKALKGRRLSESHKNKLKEVMSNALKGHIVSDKTKDKISQSHKGKTIPLEVRKKMSMSKTGDIQFTGFRMTENHRARGSTQYKEWRTKVFNRDEFTCQDCGKVGGYLEAHHIKDFATYKELRYDINNGITYCSKCHSKHDKYRKMSN